MRRLISLLLALIVFTVFTDTSARPALAVEIDNGAKIFTANCAACHVGGGNVIIATKTLKKQALQLYEMDSIEAIIYQLQNGKNAMPAFKDRLDAVEIEDVAAYVLDKAEKGW